jgi:hypothetical protein
VIGWRRESARNDAAGGCSHCIIVRYYLVLWSNHVVVAYPHNVM